MTGTKRLRPRFRLGRCNGYQAVYRISFVDFFFFLAIAIGSKFHVVRRTQPKTCGAMEDRPSVAVCGVCLLSE